jgi:hypothetical protein
MSLKGGSYQKDPKTGKVELVNKTKSIAEDRAERKAQEAAKKKSTKSGDKS